MLLKTALFGGAGSVFLGFAASFAEKPLFLGVFRAFDRKNPFASARIS